MLMVTLTFSHGRLDKVKDLLGDGQRTGLRGALQRWRNSRTYKRVVETMGLLGLVHNLEVPRAPRRLASSCSRTLVD